MADYYYDKADREAKKSPLIMRIVDATISLLSLVALVAMWLALITSHYDPSASWIFPTVGLITPAIFVVTLLFALYWIIRWRLLYALLLALPLLIALPRVSHYARLETSKHYDKIPSRGVVRVMSYNTKHFVDPEGEVTTHEVAAFIEEQRADVICLQEFNAKRFKEEDEPQLIKNYHRANVRELAIYSRYKIIEVSENLVSDEYDSGSGFWVDIVVSSDTVRIYNIHLHSTAITVQDDDYLSSMQFVGDTVREDVLRGMISRFRNTSIGRADQADSVAYSIRQSPHRVIVCGDFNDTPNSYAFRRISKGLQDSFQEVGEGYTYTYRGFMNLLRIDYILVEEPTTVLSYEVIDSVKYSDHLPVMTTLKL